MSWDERLFGRLYALARRVGRRGARAATARGLALEPARARLELVASAIAGRRLTVVLADGDGGLRGSNLVLPPRLAALATPAANAELALLRVVVSAVMARGPGPLPDGDDRRALATMTALARALAVVRTELPGAGRRLPPIVIELLGQRPSLATRAGADRALEAAAQAALGVPVATLAAAAPELAPGWLAAIAAGVGDVEPGPIRGGRAPAIALCGWLGSPDLDGVAVQPAGPERRSTAGGHERAGRARDRVRRRQLEQPPASESPLIHSFEKVHTLEKYRGGRKRIDGADELEAHGDALDELGLDEVVRSTTAASSVYRAEVIGIEGVGELAEPVEPAPIETVTYDEWDVGRGRYRPAWCQVRVEREPARAAPEVTGRFVAAALARYRRERGELATQLARLDAPPTRLGRQPDGPDIDVDAMVDRHGALARGVTGPTKLYVAQRRRPPELAVALLLDRSLSSDAYVADQRVLDVGAGALVALGAALDQLAARTAIVAFSSHTRRDCRLAMIKDFDAPWATGHARLAALEPSGYTRIGPALRHVTALLDRQPARRKLLVLLSDGKPTDYDRYEGGYGVADVRKAVGEAARDGVHVFAVALDRRARHHLPEMFGPGGFAVVTRPRDLVVAVGRLYQQRLAR